MLQAVAAANDDSGEHFLASDPKAWQQEKMAHMMQSKEAAALDKRINASAEERAAMEAAKKRAATQQKGGRRASSAWHAREPEVGAGGGGTAGGIVDDGRMGGVEDQVDAGSATARGATVASPTIHHLTHHTLHPTHHPTDAQHAGPGDAERDPSDFKKPDGG